MNNFALEIWDDEGSKCTLYSIRWTDAIEEAENNETDLFFSRFENTDDPYFTQSSQLINLLTKVIADKYGATDDFVNRVEAKAYAMPPKPTRKIEEIADLGINFPLRLYCYRVDEQVLILFNGGIKQSETAQESDDLRLRFYEAQNLSKRIEEAWRNEDIVYNPKTRKLEDFQGNESIYL